MKCKLKRIWFAIIGVLKIGGSGLYTDDDALEYKWVELDLTVGSDTLYTGLTCEVGVTGIYGNAEDYGFSGDVGTMAFTGRVGYVLPEDLMPIPLETFARISYAPESITFADTKAYVAYHVGIGLRIVQYASVFLKFSTCNVDMELDSHRWNLDDSVVQLGIVFRL